MPQIGIGPLISLLTAGAGIAGAVAGGGQDEINPNPLPPIFPQGQERFGEWLFSGMFDTPEGGTGMWRLPSPILPRAGDQMSAEVPGLEFYNLGPRYDIASMPLFPSTSNTVLDRVAENWQPWMAGSQYMADYLYNNNPLGKDDPRLKQMQQWGGTGGVGHNMVKLAAQYGAPSEAGRYVANTAQFGAPSQEMANLLSQAMTSPYMPPPMPIRTPVTRRA